jgi:hypothetical protein
MVNAAHIRYIRTMNTARTTLIAIAAAACLQPITSYAQAAGAASTAPFYQQTVYAIGFGEGHACESMEETPTALWGNQEQVDETNRVSQSGRVLTITGKHEDRSTTTYRFFLRRDECVAAAQSAGLKIAALKVAPATTAPREWYAWHQGSDRCAPSVSPADRIRQIRVEGAIPRATDVAGSAEDPQAVTVSAFDANVARAGSSYELNRITFYRSQSACTAAIPKSQPIASKYE